MNNTDEIAPTTTGSINQYQSPWSKYVFNTWISRNSNNTGPAQTVLVMTDGAREEVLGSRRIPPAFQTPYVHILFQDSDTLRPSIFSWLSKYHAHSLIPCIDKGGWAAPKSRPGHLSKFDIASPRPVGSRVVLYYLPYELKTPDKQTSRWR